ncbi:hypothetical protein SSX86_004929 [Deinandra increscens subsp. villosa]|uniref:VOC domain-containing protein n=1 Tax=Deinandra increscens subsp. villosa TaxID=3103831 RepID=A0AAP0DNW7_9ASTR
MAKRIVYEEGEIVEEIMKQELMFPALSLNHVSFICKSVSRSVKFYEQVLGFVLIRRPSSFDFEGAWLFNHGIGIHLLQMDTMTPPSKKVAVINPKDNHISFECSDVDLVMKKLGQMCIEFVTAVVKEGGVEVKQLFFHDPDGYMIEICNCHVLPVLPVSQINGKMMRSKNEVCGVDEAVMMDNLLVDMMGISF